MKKLKIILFVSLPLFGIFSVIIPAVLDLQNQYTFYLNIIPNTLAIFPYEMVLEHSKTHRDFNFQYYDELAYVLIPITNLVFWIPIAHYINRFLENRRKKLE